MNDKYNPTFKGLICAVCGFAFGHATDTGKELPKDLRPDVTTFKGSAFLYKDTHKLNKAALFAGWFTPGPTCPGCLAKSNAPPPPQVDEDAIETPPFGLTAEQLKGTPPKGLERSAFHADREGNCKHCGRRRFDHTSGVYCPERPHREKPEIGKPVTGVSITMDPPNHPPSPPRSHGEAERLRQKMEESRNPRPEAPNVPAPGVAFVRNDGEAWTGYGPEDFRGTDEESHRMQHIRFGKHEEE